MYDRAPLPHPRCGCEGVVVLLSPVQRRSSQNLKPENVSTYKIVLDYALFAAGRYLIEGYNLKEGTIVKILAEDESFSDESGTKAEAADGRVNRKNVS